MAPVDPRQRRSAGRLVAAALAAFAACQAVSWTSAAPARAEVPAPEEPEDSGFVGKVVGAAAQGATAAFVAAILSATTEPIVNRLLVERKTFGQAIGESDLKGIAKFFLTTFPTNMLKFPVFEVISMLLSFTSLSGSLRGVINGFLFCTIMLPVTNYRFRKSMGGAEKGWPITPQTLYQAYVPTVARDIVYGWARGAVGGFLNSAVAPETFFAKAMLFGLTVFFACIISSPGNEWRGYTLQRPDKKLPFFEYFKPVNYMRSTGVGATIMGVALSAGMLITPYVEQLVGVIASMF